MPEEAFNQNDERTRLANTLSEDLHSAQNIRTLPERVENIQGDFATQDGRDFHIGIIQKRIVENEEQFLSLEPHKIPQELKQKLFPQEISDTHDTIGQTLAKYSNNGVAGNEQRKAILSQIHENLDTFTPIQSDPNYAEWHNGQQQNIAQEKAAQTQKLKEMGMNETTSTLIRTMRNIEVGTLENLSSKMLNEDAKHLSENIKALMSLDDNFIQTQNQNDFARTTSGRYDYQTREQSQVGQTRPSSHNGIEPAQERPSKIQRLTPPEVGSDTETVAPNSPRPELDERSRDPREQTGL